MQRRKNKNERPLVTPSICRKSLLRRQSISRAGLRRSEGNLIYFTVDLQGDDAEEVKRVRAKAIAEAAHLDPDAAKRMIGTPDDLPQPKRPRLHPPGHPLAGMVF